MKAKMIIAVCAVLLAVGSVNSARGSEADPLEVAADALVARPVSFVATIIGSAIFVVSLPVAATSGSVDSTADALVKKPAWYTFRRPLGDFGYTDTYAKKHPRKDEGRRTAHSSKKAKSRRG